VAPRRSTRAEMTGAPAAPSSLARRRRHSPRLGVVFALVALLVQLAGPGLHAPVLIGSAHGIGNFSFAFDAHALCLASNDERPAPAAPGDKAPEADHHFAACCVWHAAAGAVTAPVALVEPVAFAASRVAFTAPPADIPARLAGTVHARAPPAGA
jgi:hypothetical protein